MANKDRNIIFITVFSLIILLSIGLIFTHQHLNRPAQAVNNSTKANNYSPSSSESTSASCHMQGSLPDPNCTPGAIDTAVNQDNIHQTICVSGYSKTVRPSLTYTNTLKREQIKEYGFIDTKTVDYEEDHLISLELGGSPTDPKNLWPEPGASPNPKDKIENELHKLVCSNQITLTDAQHRISSNWTTAINGY